MTERMKVKITQENGNSRSVEFAEFLRPAIARLQGYAFHVKGKVFKSKPPDFNFNPEGVSR
jgi:hypothetical protein